MKPRSSVDRVQTVVHHLGVLVDVGHQRDADDLLQLGQIDVAFVGLERLLGDDGQELVQFGTDQIASSRPSL